AADVLSLVGLALRQEVPGAHRQLCGHGGPCGGGRAWAHGCRGQAAEGEGDVSDFGREFRELGMPAKRTRQPPRPPAGLRLKTPRNPNYVKIREDVLAAISTLSKDKQALIPAGATLPEMMV